MQGCVTSLPIRNPLRPHAVAGTAPSKGRPSRPGDRCRGHYSTAGFAPAARVLSLTGRTRTEPLLPIALRREASTQGGTEPPHRDQSQSRPRSSLASIQVAEGGQISRRLEWCGVPMRTVEARSKLGTLGRSLSKPPDRHIRRSIEAIDPDRGVRIPCGFDCPSVWGRHLHVFGHPSPLLGAYARAPAVRGERPPPHHECSKVTTGSWH